jgi:2-haloacid dehalogenase
MRLTEALTFDCYGTLIDWETGMTEALRPLTSRLTKPLSRNDVLEAHARHESGQQAQTPGKLFRDLLAIVHRRLAEEWGVSVSLSDCVAYPAKLESNADQAVVRKDRQGRPLPCQRA